MVRFVLTLVCALAWIGKYKDPSDLPCLGAGKDPSRPPLGRNRMKFDELKDIHTHRPGRPDALLSLPPEKALAGYEMPYSLELHPWHVCEALISAFQRVSGQLRDDPNLLAIGECGLDNKCTTPLPVQIEAFKVALSTARELHLPVIIHCVGYWAEMMACVQEILPMPQREGLGVRPIVHGFRKGPQLAQQLLKAGFCISLGAHFNSQTKDIIPPNKLYWETDDDNNLEI